MLKKKIYNPTKQIKEQTIIIYHGWGSVVESQHELASKLSELGFRVIVPEIIYHDTRNPFTNPFMKEIMQEYFWKTIFYTIDEIDILVEELGIPKEKLILIGSSMGGFIASGIIAANPGFAGLVNINGSSAFMTSENIFRKQDGREKLTFSEQKQFNLYDPLKKEIKYSHPILFMHGKQDEIVSIRGQEEYFTYLLKNGSNAQFKVYENINHTISNEMVDDLLAWLLIQYP